MLKQGVSYCARFADDDIKVQCNVGLEVLDISSTIAIVSGLIAHSEVQSLAATQQRILGRLVSELCQSKALRSAEHHLVLLIALPVAEMLPRRLSVILI